MRVGEYRDLCAEVRDACVAFHACVDGGERDRWRALAASKHTQAGAAACARATDLDRVRMDQALADLEALMNIAREALPATIKVDHPAHQPAAASMSRAAGYNRSPARAVRLRRAARSAMRRGYF